MTRPALRSGAALVMVYVAVALATASWAPGRLRPLFDGFGSHPGVYNWVKPPAEFAEGNVAPEAAQARVAINTGGSAAVLEATTPDAQAGVSLPPASVPPHRSDTAVRLEVRPVDSGTLGPLPPGLRAEGNAYQMTVTYIPSETQVTTTAAPGILGVTSEVASDTLLFSADGRSWRPVEATPISGSPGLTGPFTETGYYLPAGRGEPRAAAASGTGTPVALLAVAAAVPLLLGYLLLGRRHRTNRSSTPPIGREPRPVQGRGHRGAALPRPKITKKKPR